MNKNKKLLYFASSKKIGLTYHLTIASKYFSKIEEIDYILISGNSEQFEGLFRILKENNIKYNTFEGIDEIRNFFRNIILFLKYIRKEQFDVIYAQTNVHLLYAILGKIFCKTKIIFTIHSHRHGEQVKSTLMSIVLSLILNIFADKVISLSSTEKKHWIRYLLKTDFITLGFELPNFVGKKWDENMLYVVYPAVFTKRKEHHWLLEALIPILKEYPDIILVLPGKGPTLEICKNIVKKHKLSHKVIFPGWVDKAKLNNYMSKANLAVVASKSELGGHCIVEPLFYSLPVISTPVGIASDVIKDNYNGFIINYNDKKTLQEKMLYFYNN